MLRRGLIFFAVVCLVLTIIIFKSGGKGVKAQGPTIVSIGPGGGSIQILVADPKTPSKLYVVTNGRIFISADAGSSWSFLNSIKIQTITGRAGSISIDPNNTQIMYASLGINGLSKSIDGGHTWNTVNTGVPANTSIESVAVSPGNSNNIFIGSFNQGIYKSTDAGSTWVRADNPHLQVGIFGFSFDPNNTNIIFVSTSNGILKSQDGGNLWVFTSPGVGAISQIVIDPINSKNIYAGTPSGVFKSIDGGLNWAFVNQGIPSNDPISIIAIDPTNPSIIYAVAAGIQPLPATPLGTPADVYKSINGGANWSSASSRLPNRELSALVLDPSNPSTLYAATPGGVFKSSDSGGTWSSASLGIDAAVVPSIVMDPTNPNILYVAVNGAGVYKSTDAGQTWINESSGIEGSNVNLLAIDPSNPLAIYAATSTGVAKSIDGGSNWSSLNTGFPGASSGRIAVDPTNTSNLIASISQINIVLIKSTDAGATWQASNNGFQQFSFPEITSIAFDPNVQNTIYIGTSRNGLYKSTNGGGTWSQLDSIFSDSGVGQVLVDPRMANTIYVLSCGLLKSTDAGSTFTPVNNQPLCAGVGFPVGMSEVLLDPVQSNVIYTAARDGVYRTSDGGINWGILAPSSSSVISLAVPSGVSSPIYAGTSGSGILEIVPAADTVPPTLSITTPAGGSLIGSRSVFVSGTAKDDPLGGGLASISVNGQFPDFDPRTEVYSTTLTAPADGPFHGKCYCDRFVWQYQHTGDLYCYSRFHTAGYCY